MQNSRGKLSILIIAILLSSALWFNSTYGDQPLVLCTTSVLASIVEDLASDQVAVDVIASPAICPAHYDVKPSDIESFKMADLILMHGMEKWVESLKEASQSTAPIVKISGPWNTPSNLKERYMDVAKALEENLQINLESQLQRCLNAISETEEWLNEFAGEHGFKDTPVVCMEWQKAFINFLGFKIVATYGPPEMVSASQLESILTNATQNKALLVIDNLQSGTDLGEQIASQIGGVEVALTNFPGTSPNLNNVTAIMKWNAQRLAEALQTAENQHEIIILQNQIQTLNTAMMALTTITIILLVICIILAIQLRRRGKPS